MKFDLTLHPRKQILAVNDKKNNNLLNKGKYFGFAADKLEVTWGQGNHFNDHS